MTKELMMQAQAIRMQEKGQVTIPLEIRKKLGLKKGDLVTFVETEAGVLIKPAEVIVSQALDELSKILEENEVSLEELMAQARKTRRKLAREKYHLKTTK
jgi:AbrB family looped-hinge helix DNA binding protein